MTLKDIVTYARTHNWVSWAAHAGMAITCQVIIAIVLSLFFGMTLTAAFTAGALFSIGLYYGREKAQIEEDAHAFPGPLNWYLPWKWGLDGFMDWAAPTAAVLLILLLL